MLSEADARDINSGGMFFAYQRSNLLRLSGNVSGISIPLKSQQSKLSFSMLLEFNARDINAGGMFIADERLDLWYAKKHPS